MPKSWMIADFLRPYAQWRIDRAEERDDGRNARAAIGLIDAAAYAMQLDDSDRLIIRLTIAGCFAFEGFNPGAEGERLVRRWHYDDTCGAPRDLLLGLADAAERGIQADAVIPPSRRSTRWRALGRPSADASGASSEGPTAHGSDGFLAGSHSSGRPSNPLDARRADSVWLSDASAARPVDNGGAQAEGERIEDADARDVPDARPADTADSRRANGSGARPADTSGARPANGGEARSGEASEARTSDSSNGSSSDGPGPRSSEGKSSPRSDGSGGRGKGKGGRNGRGGKGRGSSVKLPKPRRGENHRT